MPASAGVPSVRARIIATIMPRSGDVRHTAHDLAVVDPVRVGRRVPTPSGTIVFVPVRNRHRADELRDEDASLRPRSLKFFASSFADDEDSLAILARNSVEALS